MRFQFYIFFIAALIICSISLAEDNPSLQPWKENPYYWSIHNKPVLLLGRFLFLEQALRTRTHARRDSIVVKEGVLTEKIALLESSTQRDLHKALDRLRQQKPVDNLANVLQPLFDS